MEDYVVKADSVPAQVKIDEEEEDYVYHYHISRPRIKQATSALIGEIREELVQEVNLSAKEFIDAKELNRVKKKFREKAEQLMEENLPEISKDNHQILIGNLLHEMLGLGDIELLLADHHLEEIVINSSSEPIWVYHKKYGWLKTDIVLEDEDTIYNYAATIGRRVGKQISNLHPLLDAHLPSGDRTNATIFPISTQGNTITIRKFARSPWTITDFIENHTVNKEIAALLWLCLQYEMNVIISGGTGSGKTSFLNVLTPFIPPNQRIVSIEDTREIRLPEFLHWVPLTTKEENPQGKGGVSMLDLLVNSLRMRPDRIIVGEIRRKKQAEVLFEAMHTGHSVYSTLHANTSQQTLRRLTNPPINVPVTLLEAVDLNVVMFRDRRKNIRRVREVAEVITQIKSKESNAQSNTFYRWFSKHDETRRQGDCKKIYQELEMHTGMNKEEADQEVEKRKKILGWMVDHEVNNVDNVGKVVAEFYKDRQRIIDAVEDDEDPETII